MLAAETESDDPRRDAAKPRKTVEQADRERDARRRHAAFEQRQDQAPLSRGLQRLHPSRRPPPPRLDAMQKGIGVGTLRSEEHTSELQSLMRISYAVFCLNKQKNQPSPL